MALVLHIKQGLGVFDKTDEENAERSEETDEEHALQDANCHHDQEIHEQDILFERGTIEQAENRIGAE